jgi:hypothetical protein
VDGIPGAGPCSRLTGRPAVLDSVALAMICHEVEWTAVLAGICKKTRL